MTAAPKPSAPISAASPTGGRRRTAPECFGDGLLLVQRRRILRLGLLGRSAGSVFEVLRDADAPANRYPSISRRPGCRSSPAERRCRLVDTYTFPTGYSAIYALPTVRVAEIYSGGNCGHRARAGVRGNPVG